MVAEGCARAGVAHKSDLYMRDGKTLRQELRDGGEWEDQEWAKEVVQAYWAQGIDDDRVHQHDMPRVRANVGMVVSYYEGDGKRERRIGCVRRVYVGEHGVEYEVVCSEYRKGSSGRAAKVRRYEPRRGDVVTPGWNKSGQRMQVMWRGGSREGTRVSGEVVSGNDETRDCCRVLDLAGRQEDERRMREWMEGGCMLDIEVGVVSTMRHVRGETKDRSEWATTVTSSAPGIIESDGVRRRLEGCGVGCKPARAYDRQEYDTANDGNTTLYGFSDGSMSGDRNYGGYSWIVVLRSERYPMGKVVMGGGGAEAATANGNVLLNTTRMEALGLVAGMSYARGWKGPVKWYLDNNGARRNYRKMRHWTAYDWCKAGAETYLDTWSYCGRVWLGSGRCYMWMGTLKSAKSERTGPLKKEVTWRLMPLRNGV